ncbi:MAG: helix-turn-helix transcriptional regulator [Desulfosalsimonadaceae bacterium]
MGDELLKKIGINIRELRKAQNFTQEQLAEKAGLSYKYLGEIERGEKNSGILNLFRIAHGLSLSLRDIVNIENKTKTEEEKLRFEIMGLLASKNGDDLKRAFKMLKVILEYMPKNTFLP